MVIDTSKVTIIKSSLKIGVFILLVIKLTTCNPSAHTPVSKNNSNLLAYFPFDQHANDTVNPQLKGKIYGATSVEGIKGRGYHFDGIDDYIEIEQSNQSFNFEYQDAYSISFWVKPAPQQNDLAVHENDLLSKWVIHDADTSHLKTGYPFSIRMLNQKSKKRKGKWYLANWGGYIDNCEFGNKIVSESTLQSQFHHIVFTQNKTELKLFLDGQLVSSKENKTMCTTKNNASLRIGKRGGLKYQNHFAGVIDELRVYKVALSVVEIAELNRVK